MSTCILGGGTAVEHLLSSLLFSLCSVLGEAHLVWPLLAGSWLLWLLYAC